jgi:transporter family-2 protein
VGWTLLTAIALAVTGGDAPGGWSAPAPQWIGGALGVVVVVVAAWTVSTLGVLRLTLAMVAGQSAGALAVDLVAPVEGQAMNVQTAIGVVLTLAAVVVSGRGAGGSASASSSGASRPAGARSPATPASRAASRPGRARRSGR